MRSCAPPPPTPPARRPTVPWCAPDALPRHGFVPRRSCCPRSPPDARRRLVCRLLNWTGAQVRSTELTKASFLTAVDGRRAAAGGLGAELVGSGLLDRPDDTFYLTVPELLAPLPANVRELMTFRRARREECRGLEVPSVFTGMPAPIETADRPIDGDPLFMEHPQAQGYSTAPCGWFSTRSPKTPSTTVRCWSASSWTPGGRCWYLWPAPW